MRTKTAKQVRKYLSKKYGASYREMVTIETDLVTCFSANRDDAEKLQQLDISVENHLRLMSGRLYDRPAYREDKQD